MPSCNNIPEADERVSVKKEQISSYLDYKNVSLGKMAGKAEPFHEDQLKVNLQSNI